MGDTPKNRFCTSQNINIPSLTPPVLTWEVALQDKPERIIKTYLLKNSLGDIARQLRTLVECGGYA